MALSGLDIYKLLPKTNCRDCGFPTCLAFSLSLAKKAVALDKCPHISQQAKELLELSTQPPIKLIRIGGDENKVEIGNESVLFRHEEKFHHPTAIGFIIHDNLSNDGIKGKLEDIKKLQFERIGQLLKTDVIAIKQTKDAGRFAEVVKLISGMMDSAIVLMSDDAEGLRSALTIIAKKKPLIYATDKTNIERMIALSKEYGVGLVIKGQNLEEIAQLAKETSNKGISELVLDVKSNNLAGKTIWDLTQIRRQALKKSNRALGYPVIVITDKDDAFEEIIAAGDCVSKYASIVLLNKFHPWAILSLLTLRQNIYTDPQKPLQIEPKVYSVGNTTKASPVLVTTNFSLTYYTVLGEVEASKIPTNILSVDTEGMSVLTAWAAEKFTPEKISETIKKYSLEDTVSHRNLIIPGYVAVMSGDLEEKSGWKVIVGPKEAAGIPTFLKNL